MRPVDSGKRTHAAKARGRMGFACALWLGLAWPLAAAANASIQDLGKLSLQDLGNIVVTSVAKTPEPLSNAPASVYVITHDEIMRSGATSLPEMLRLAPNLQVFQTSPSTWVITARGFAGSPGVENLPNKLLVLIDGRSVYNPLFSGMYWEMQGVLPENVDRIEVISGPGAALWGANAVNGVINIITRNSADTQGGLLTAALGNRGWSTGVQYGGKFGRGASYRVYATDLHDDEFETSPGNGAGDAWSKSQAGFRIDWSPQNAQASVEGDLFNGRQHQGSAPDQLISGGNLQTNWQWNFGDDSSLQLLAYFDRVHKMAAPHAGGFTINTFDVELQRNFMLAGWNQISWGAGERRNQFSITNSPSFMFPERFTLNVANLFAQDQLALGRHLAVTLGIKLEDDPYSGFTPMPSLRAAWTFDHGGTLWVAASRAVRAPTPLDTEVEQTVGGRDFLLGNPDFLPEKLTATELGYRQQLSSRASVSITLFNDHYDDLKTIEATPVTLLPLYFGNGMRGTSRASGRGPAGSRWTGGA